MCWPGASGNDVYYLGAGDSAVEEEDAGTDRVYTYADYTLADNLEHLYLNVATAATLNGNALANSLRGNAGDDTLDRPQRQRHAQRGLRCRHDDRWRGQRQLLRRQRR
jgi:hypothetical protein